MSVASIAMIHMPSTPRRVDWSPSILSDQRLSSPVITFSVSKVTLILILPLDRMLVHPHYIPILPFLFIIESDKPFVKEELILRPTVWA